VLLGAAQKSLCGQSCDGEDKCKVEENGRGKVRNEVMNYTRGVIITVLGPNN